MDRREEGAALKDRLDRFQLQAVVPAAIQQYSEGVDHQQVAQRALVVCPQQRCKMYPPNIRRSRLGIAFDRHLACGHRSNSQGGRRRCASESPHARRPNQFFTEESE
jgi:hypothetical protein